MEYGNQYLISKSFYDWCIENDRQDLLDRWDYELNKCSPTEIGYGSNKKWYFKCPRGLHESEQLYINHLVIGKATTLKCKKCESVAQYVIDKFGEDYLWSHWNKNNQNNPYDVAHGSNKKVIIQCQNKDYHIYEQDASSFSNGIGCPYCNGLKTHELDSLGTIYPQVLSIWSDKNKKSPYEYSPHSADKVWFKCQDALHKDYFRQISNSSTYDFRCPECSAENNSRIPDLIGKTFGRLTVIEQDLDKKVLCSDGIHYRTYWKCKCSCESGKIKSVETYRLTSLQTQSCGCLHKEAISGENNHSWKGGVSTEIQLLRETPEYYKWRKDVFAKDKYTCQCCGQVGGNLQAHHIENFSSNSELRYDIENGITLCDKHHASNIVGGFHNLYGTQNNTPEQLVEYINKIRSDLGITEIFSLSNNKMEFKRA